MFVFFNKKIIYNEINNNNDKKRRVFRRDTYTKLLARKTNVIFKNIIYPPNKLDASSERFRRTS